MNTLCGERWQMYQSSASVNSIEYNFALGSGITAAPDHCIVARLDLDLALATPFNVDISGSATSAFGSPVTSTNGSITTASLIGPRSDDYICTFTLDAKQFWKVEIYPDSGTIAHVFSKMYLGTFFDFAEEPDYEIVKVPARESKFYSSSGGVFFARLDEPMYRVTFEWRRIADDKVKEFYANVVRYKHRHGYFLYTRSNHNPLDGKQLIHSRLIEVSTFGGQKADSNTVIATFEEMLG